jgi:hypothetical protein
VVTVRSVVPPPSAVQPVSESVPIAHLTSAWAGSGRWTVSVDFSMSCCHPRGISCQKNIVSTSAPVTLSSFSASTPSMWYLIT